MHRRNGSAGFTLIELLTVIVILSITGVFSAHFIATAAGTYLDVTIREDLVRGGKIGLERMVREIRGLASPTGFDVLSLSSQELSFRNAAGTTISYRFDGSAVLRNGVPLIEWVDSFSFKFFQRDGDSTLNANTLHSVEITFTLLRSGESIPFRATVYPSVFDKPFFWWHER